MESVDSFLKQLESIMRGKRIDESALLHQANDFYCKSREEFQRSDSESLEEDKEGRQKIIDAAVALYNKAKAVVVQPNTTLSECVAYLKASAAWMLSTYGHSSTKFVVMHVRLHCRAASDMLQVGQRENASDNLTHACECWSKLNAQALERILSPMDLEGLRYVAFNGLMDYCMLLREGIGRGTDKDREEKLGKCVGLVLDLLPYLPSECQRFCRLLLDIGQEQILAGSYEAGLHYLRTTVSTLRQHQITPGNDRTERGDNNNLLLVKALLAMAYAFQELGQYEKALESVNASEEVPFPDNSSQSVSSETFAFAKLSIHCRQGDAGSASAQLRRLIQEAGSFDMALNAVVLLIQGAAGMNTSEDQWLQNLEYFQLLGEKFQRDPEFTTSRIAHLQYSLLGARPSDSQEDNSGILTQRAMSISKAIILDHQQRVHPLTEGDSLRFLQLLQERVKLKRFRSEWDEVIQWCDMLLSFLPASDVNNKVVVMMWKAGACTHVSGREEEALALSVACAEMTPCTRTMLLVLHAALCVRPPQQAVHIFLEFHRGKGNVDTSLPEDGNKLYVQSDGEIPSSTSDLSRLLMACKVVRECEATKGICVEVGNGWSSKCDVVISQLLAEWVVGYKVGEHWRHTLLGPNPTGNANGGGNVGLDLCVHGMTQNVAVPAILSEDFLSSAPSHSDEGTTTTLLSVLSELCQLFLCMHLNIVRDGEERPSISYSQSQHNVASNNATVNKSAEVTSDELLDGVKNSVESEVAQNNTEIASTEDLNGAQEEFAIDAEGTSNSVGNRNSISLIFRENDVGNETADETYVLYGSLHQIRSGLLVHIQSFLEIHDVVDSSGAVNLCVLGGVADIYWLGDLAWNVGVLLMHKDRCGLCDPSGESCEGQSEADRYALGAEFFEAASRLYRTTSSYPRTEEVDCKRNSFDSVSLRNQVTCLLVASALRLDIDELIFEKSECNKQTSVETILISNDQTVKMRDTAFEIDKNIATAEKNIQLASDLLRRLLGYGDSEQRLRKIFLMLSLAVKCRTSAVDTENYISQHQDELLSFSAQELVRCADIVLTERGGTQEGGRRILLYAIQVLTRATAPDYPLIGTLYRRLIILSPSRTKAMEWIEEFEQLIKSFASTDANNSTVNEASPFHNSDIDTICTTCYNWSVTLVELGQHDLAEKFACKSLGLTKYASPHIAKLKETIQDAYLYILKLKADRRGNDTVNRVTCFGVNDSTLVSVDDANATVPMDITHLQEPM